MRACRLLGSVRGYVAPGFERCERLSGPMCAGKTQKCASRIVKRGRLVVDVVAGNNCAAATSCHVFSSGKVLESLCVAKLVDMGRLSYDAPIGKYWPRFAKPL